MLGGARRLTGGALLAVAALGYAGDLPIPIANPPAVVLGVPQAIPRIGPPATVVRGASPDLPTAVAPETLTLAPLVPPSLPGNDDLAAPPLPARTPLAAPAPAVSAKPADPLPPVRRTSRSGEHTSHFCEDFWDKCCNFWEGCTTGAPGRKAFESDHGLDIFASPITSPSYLEDPRALTEVRPLFYYQTLQNSDPNLNGGHAMFYGVQGRIALTDHLSFVLNKLGGASINPGDGATIADGSGFAEIHLGPKFTFYRSPERGTAVAAGVTFEIPAGTSKAFQSTGSLGVVPYLTAAQNFGRTSYGSFNVMDTAAYHIAVAGKRSDFFYNGLHLDYDVGNAHHFYPMLELNWYHYTQSGSATPAQFEGRDFANVGATNVNGRDYLSLAPGFRYKFSEHVQAGVAVEFPLTSPRDLQEFRLTLDLIFRY